MRQFLRDRARDGETVWILLDESQEKARGALAREAVTAFRALGIKAEVKRTDSPGVFCEEERVHLYQNWRDLAPFQHIDHHLALIGGEAESVLVEELQENQLLPRPLSANYPGPRRGVVALIRSPFAYGRDVLGLFGPDMEGLRAAIGKLTDFKQETPRAADTSPAELEARELAGSLQPGTPFESMDGAPCQRIAVSRDGQQIALGVLGYAKNLFVFGPRGELLLEDKIGHVNTHTISLLDDGRLALGSDGATYLRLPDGNLPWRVPDGSPGSKAHVDPAGRYLVRRTGNGFVVSDFDRKVLWKFDEWEQCSTTLEILLGRKGHFLGAFDEGRAIVYRRVGKAPGIAGAYADDVIWADALTGKAKRVVPFDEKAIVGRCGADAKATVTSLSFFRNGEFAIARVSSRQDQVLALLDADLNFVQSETMGTPPYLGGTSIKTEMHLLPDRRLLFTIGDMLCVSDPAWTQCSHVRTEHLILTFVVDETRQRVAVSNYVGKVVALDFALRRVWQTEVGSAAQLAFLPDGRLAVGTLRGKALLLDTAGRVLWERSLNRYAPPEEVERRWAEMEAVPSMGSSGTEPWWERLERNVELVKQGDPLSGTVSAPNPVLGTTPGEAFGTYLVEWHLGPAQGDSTLVLDITEVEKAKKDQVAGRERRVTLSARPGAKERVERTLLYLGDRPDLIETSVRVSGKGEVRTSVILRRLAFPSENIVRMPSLYRGAVTEAERTNPPVTVDIFFNVTGDAPHTTRRIDPLAFVNGRRSEAEPQLLRGNWFGGPISTQGKEFAVVPCWVELTLPRKRVITHIAIAEDPRAERVRTLSVDAYIESRETRKGLSAFERRQLKRGFWHNVVKRRNNTDTYNVYRFEKPVFTRQLRVYVLGGHSSITETELYGAIPDELKRR